MAVTPMRIASATPFGCLQEYELYKLINSGELRIPGAGAMGRQPRAGAPRAFQTRRVPFPGWNGLRPALRQRPPQYELVDQVLRLVVHVLEGARHVEQAGLAAGRVRRLAAD